MTARLGWLTHSLSDVPADDLWLGPRERHVLSGMRGDKRRREWRLGRCVAKAAAAAWLSIPPERVEILPGPDGAPHAYLGGETGLVAISLSHRADRALAVVAEAGCDVGCDIEVDKPRSRAFVNGWLSHAERSALEAATADDRHRLANAMWAARESAAKVGRAGVRLDARGGAATLHDVTAVDGTWRRWSVSLGTGATIAGWWRAERGWVMAAAAEPPSATPLSLDHSAR